MDVKKARTAKREVLIGVYRSSMSISLIAMTVVGAIELFMLAYTIVNPALYGAFITKYRAFYAVLFATAVAYIALNLYAKGDLEHRHRLLRVANPLCAILFFAWSLLVTYSDAIANGMIDSTVFMTFSMSVPLIFYLFPGVYAAIAAIASGLMLYLTVAISGSAASIINLSIFFTFQLILGISFLRLKLNLTERIVAEREISRTDAMTGFLNRRAYSDDMEELAGTPAKDGLIYLSVDVNGLKEVNDTKGHEAGDKLIVGTAQCIEQNFGEFGKLYRIGGDEFAGILYAPQEEMGIHAERFEKSMEAWAGSGGTTLSASYGYVCGSEYPGSGITALANKADERMYAAKEAYYRTSGKDRRKYGRRAGAGNS